MGASRALSGHPVLGGPVAAGQHVVASGHAALGAVGLGGGGGGLAHLILRLFIWRAIWRLGLLIWRVPTFGPFILLLIILALVVLAFLRARRGRGWPGGPRGPGQGRADPFGDRGSPRDW